MEFGVIKLVKILLRKLRKSKCQLSSDTTSFEECGFINLNSTMALTVGAPGTCFCVQEAQTVDTSGQGSTLLFWYLQSVKEDEPYT